MLDTRPRRIAAGVSVLTGLAVAGAVWWLFGDDLPLLIVGLAIAIVESL